MRNKLLIVAAIALVALSSAAYADSDLMQLNANADAAKKAAAQEGWQGSVSLGYLATTGNTDTSSLNGKALFGYKSGNWQDVLLLQTLKASQDGATTAESTEFNGQSDYNFTDTDFVFGNLDYLRDTFSGYQHRSTEIVGYGRRLLASDTQQLDVQIGAGARQTRFTDDTSNSELVEQLAASYLWKFTAKSNFSENLSVVHGASDTFTQSVTALTTNLAGNFALSLSYTVKHNSTVLPGFKNTDTITAISLIYSF